MCSPALFNTTYLGHEGSKLQRQLFTNWKVALVNFFIHLIRQQEALSLSLPFCLCSKAQPRKHAQIPGSCNPYLLNDRELNIILDLIWKEEVSVNDSPAFVC